MGTPSVLLPLCIRSRSDYRSQPPRRRRSRRPRSHRPQPRPSCLGLPDVPAPLAPPAPVAPAPAPPAPPPPDPTAGPQAPVAPSSMNRAWTASPSRPVSNAVYAISVQPLPSLATPMRVAPNSLVQMTCRDPRQKKLVTRFSNRLSKETDDEAVNGLWAATDPPSEKIP